MYKMKGVHYMRLYELVYNVAKEVEREKGNFPKEEVVREKTDFILKHSSMKYDEFGLFISSFSKLGIEAWKDAELELPKYMLFSVSYDYQDWEIQSYNDLKRLEFNLRNAEDIIQVALFDGVIKDYNIIEDTFNGLVIWKDPIYKIEYTTEDKKDREILIYDDRRLEEEIRKAVKEKYENIQVFNINEGMYEHFYVKDVVFSTDCGERPSEVIWGKSEMTFFDLANDEEDIW